MAGRKKADLGLDLVDRTFSMMQIDEAWSVREPRGFTWWGGWISQRVWAGDPGRNDGETLWQIRSRAAGYRDVPDDDATYALVNEMNSVPQLGAFVYDAEDRTVSARCGVLLYEAIPWLQRFFVAATAYSASIAWKILSARESDLTLDATEHPTAGPRRDPDDMLNVAGSGTTRPGLTPTAVRRAAKHLATVNPSARFDADDASVEAIVGPARDTVAIWGASVVDHPGLGPGVATHLVLPKRNGARRAAWIANGLNLAEASDWRGEVRPYALGAWAAEDGVLVHRLFLPGDIVGDKVGDSDASALIANLHAWGAVRAGFAYERLPWLEAGAASRYPDDDPVELEPEEDRAAPPLPPMRERSWGPAAREPRPRSDPSAPRRPVAEHLVDPADPSAFGEIDDAVAVAEDGDRIRIRPGVYRKPVVLDRAVELVGEGPREAIVLEPVGGECLGAAASGGVVRGLTIRPSRVGNDGGDYSAVSVRDVSVLVEDCDLTTHLGATVWVGGPSSLATIRRCRIVGGAQNGLWVTEEGRAELIDCEVRGHRWPVTASGMGCTLRVVGGTIADNLHGGIDGAEGAQVVIEGATIVENAGNGVGFYAAAPSSAVVGCEIARNGGPGVELGGAPGMRVERNRIHANTAGILVGEGGNPVLIGNDVAENTDVGIGVTGDKANPAVRENTVRSADRVPVVVRQGAGGTFEQNRIFPGETPGIWVVDEGSNPVFRGNTVSGGMDVAVVVGGHAGGAFEGNDLRGNRSGSWRLEEPGQVRRAGNLEDTGAAEDPPSGPASARRMN